MLLDNLQSSEDDKQAESDGWALQLKVIALAAAVGLTSYFVSRDLETITSNEADAYLRDTHLHNVIHGKSTHNARATRSGGDSGTWDPATMTITLDRTHGK